MSPGREIYHMFERRGLTHSHRHFSRELLQVSDNYMCHRADRGPSADVLIGLFQRLWRSGQIRMAIQVGWSVLWMPPEARR